MTQPWLCSSRFKLISVGLEIHGWSCKAIQFVANDPVKFNNAISTCLINLNVILYIFFNQIFMNVKYIFFFGSTMINWEIINSII